MSTLISLEGEVDGLFVQTRFKRWQIPRSWTGSHTNNPELMPTGTFRIDGDHGFRCTYIQCYSERGILALSELVI
jgi:hypothetical protein